MNRRLLFLPFMLLAAAAAVGGSFFVKADETPEDDSAVLVMTKSNFEDTLKENEVVLVKFYAPW